MRDYEKKERMDADSVIRRLKLISEEDIALDLSEFKVLEEINYIAQDIHYSLGSFLTENIYQKAFETELQLRPEQFDYDREYPLEILYRGKKMGELKLDFVLYPNKEYFNFKDVHPIIIEMKSKDTNISENKWLEEDDDKFTQKLGKTAPRQQLWKYLNNVENDKKLMMADIGILINFSDELKPDVGFGGTARVGDSLGANLEVWQMRRMSMNKLKPTDNDFVDEMYFMYETFPEPMSRKEMIDLRNREYDD